MSNRFRLLFWIFAIPAILLLPSVIRAEGPVSFQRDVMALLARAGCNQGACHGNLNGKGGFKLSLRGEDPDFDYNVMTRDFSARRLDPQKPAESLFLRKAAGLVSHEGGPRFSKDSREYQLIFDWIAAGMPRDPETLPKLTQLEVEPKARILDSNQDRFRIQATAIFADGTRRDVTNLCALESTNPTLVALQPDGEVRRLLFGETNILVRYLNRTVAVPVAFLPERKGFHAVQTMSSNPVDRHLFPQWVNLKIQPSEKSNDSMFLRRVYLDVLGRLPTAEEARDFLNDPTTEKRSVLIDKLLQRPEFADFWALKWSDLLRNEEKSLDSKGVRIFHQWIREAIQNDRPMNEFARELVSARGSSYSNPPTNLYRALREPYARAESIAQVFLGVRLQCAKCHNHPFDIWTQDDYHRFAALFAQIDYRILANKRADDLDKHEFNGEQVIFLMPGKELSHPRTKQPLQPRLLGSQELLPYQSDRTAELANWIAQPDNPFFAKAQVNRIWYHLFGRGIVEPNDDFRLSNPPSNPELLEELADRFKKDHFNLRAMLRLILNSETYQLSSIPNETNAEDELHFSKSAALPLEAEQLVDAMLQVSGSKMKFNGYPSGTRAVQMAAPLHTGRRSSGLGEKFMKVFGKPERLLTCECERSEDAGLLQSLQMINGEIVQSLISDKNNVLKKYLQPGQKNETIVEELFLSGYGRLPNPKEKEFFTQKLETAKDRRVALEDLLWGILNSKEFLIRR
ncbi:DUF1553 domain-containing protein [Telmatocola sphagniphila]|uniref:DUF1553 domain-containing protein n=1 Tax=Telmatocola sphagniphila TaxID=1123043 RepID=A0A8E6EZM9_9BACT|nr:DUF1549 and DUF1553 domain-containing protein [Telmatocola sphagniphila]QVL33641.1 DUF1553 domain-containing protein [Telmatocola sphagniphila]